MATRLNPTKTFPSSQKVPWDVISLYHVSSGLFCKSRKRKRFSLCRPCGFHCSDLIPPFSLKAAVEGTVIIIRMGIPFPEDAILCDYCPLELCRAQPIQPWVATPLLGPRPLRSPLPCRQVSLPSMKRTEHFITPAAAASFAADWVVTAGHCILVSSLACPCPCVRPRAGAMEGGVGGDGGGRSGLG